MRRFLRCLAQAVIGKGWRLAVGLIPLAQSLLDVYDIAEETLRLYRSEGAESNLRQEVEQLVQADAAEVARSARAVAQEVLAGHPVEEVNRLEDYLRQVPAVARQSLARPKDPGGRTVPAQMNLLDPAQLSTLLPRRLPQFRAGDPIPGATQWRLVQLLGSGGFGEVWLATHTFLNKKRAFKFCLDPQARDRLLRYEGEVVRQVMAASQLFKPEDHGIVALEDAHLEGEIPWLAYEYIEGGDLTMLIREYSGKPPSRRGRLAIQLLINLAKVVGQLHTLPTPVIHRDLKPANIMLKQHEGRWLLRITDFGISHIEAERRLQDPSYTEGRMSLGATYRGAYTPLYASPQQRRGLRADPRDDVYALGVIGWQTLIGDIGAERPAGKWRLRVAEAGLPARVLDVLESCWDDEPEGRPANAAVLADQLRQALRSDESNFSSKDLDKQDQHSSPDQTAATSISSVAVSPGYTEAQIAAAVQAWGGRFVRDDQLPGKPITEVDLRFLAIDDRHVELLAGLPSLKVLYLGSTQVTDRGLAALRPLKNLRILDLSCTEVTDASISLLLEWRQLVHLDLRGTRLTETGILQLQPILPRCQILYCPPFTS